MASYRKQGTAFEKKWSFIVGGTLVPGSGSSWVAKGDVVNRDKKWLFQCKDTKKDFYTLKLIDIFEIKSQATKLGYNWGFVINFQFDDIYVICGQVPHSDSELETFSINKSRRLNKKDIKKDNIIIQTKTNILYLSHYLTFIDEIYGEY